MIQIAIDGPAGAGKSTVAKQVAARLSINYLDTGAMYRAMAVAVLRQGIDIAEHEKVKKALEHIDISVRYTTDKGQRVLANGQDLTDFIRTPEATKGSSDIAVIPAVRLKLVAIQRQVAEQYDIVMDGRDIGTYVLPDAKAKFFVTASVAERAQRRFLELQATGAERPLAQLEAEIAARDKTDSEREFAPLRQAADAILVDTTNMGIAEVVDFVIAKIKEVYGDAI